MTPEPGERKLFISPEARRQLLALAPDVRRNIGQRLRSLQTDFSGDIKKLHASKRQYRLRVGVFRILFRLDQDRIEVYAVKHRREAYE